jgi:hypothetical protein
MPPKLNLKGFLRHDLLSRRTRALIPYYSDYNASRNFTLKHEPEVTDPLTPRPATPLGDYGKGEANPARDVDSLFGEPIYTKDEILQQKLEQLLAEDRKKDQSVKQQQSQYPNLENLKAELNALVVRELEAGREERELIQRQKSVLISSLGKLEVKIRGERVKGCKGVFSPN